jgi:hypothetical protein
LTRQEKRVWWRGRRLKVGWLVLSFPIAVRVCFVASAVLLENERESTRKEAAEDG